MTVMAVNADSSQFRFGTQCLKVTTGSTGNNAIYPALNIPVTPGQQYTLSAYIKTNAPITGGYIALRLAPGGSLTQFAESAQVTDTSASTDNGWQRLILTATIPAGVFSVRPIVVYTGTTVGQVFWLDGVKHEPGAVASEWLQNLVSGQATHDPIGSMIDASQGGVWRLIGSTGGARDTVQLGAHGLQFGGDTDVYSSFAGILDINGTSRPAYGSLSPFHLSGALNPWVLAGTASSGGKWAKLATGTLTAQYSWNVLSGRLATRYRVVDISLLITDDAGLTSQPAVNIHSLSPNAPSPTIVVVVESLNPIVWSLWVTVPNNFEDITWYPLDMTVPSWGGSITMLNPASLGWQGSYAAGTGYGDTPALYFGTDNLLYRGGAGFLRTSGVLLADGMAGATPIDRGGTGDNTTITTAGTYYPLTNGDTGLITPTFVGQRWQVNMTGFLQLGTATVQYALIRVDIVDSANTLIATLGYTRTDNVGGSGRGGAVAFSKVWTADAVAQRKVRLMGTVQTTSGTVITLNYTQAQFVPVL